MHKTTAIKTSTVSWHHKNSKETKQPCKVFATYNFNNVSKLGVHKKFHRWWTKMEVKSEWNMLSYKSGKTFTMTGRSQLNCSLQNTTHK